MNEKKRSKNRKKEEQNCRVSRKKKNKLKLLVRPLTFSDTLEFRRRMTFRFSRHLLFIGIYMYKLRWYFIFYFEFMENNNVPKSPTNETTNKWKNLFEYSAALFSQLCRNNAKILLLKWNNFDRMQMCERKEKWKISSL